jgi:hypothetical protein
MYGFFFFVMPYNSGRGGARPRSGRPFGSNLPDSSPTHRVRIPADVDRDLLLDCYYALLDAQSNRSSARTHDALNKLLNDIFGV